MARQNAMRKITEKQINEFPRAVLIDLCCVKLEELHQKGIYLYVKKDSLKKWKEDKVKQKFAEEL